MVKEEQLKICKRDLGYYEYKYGFDTIEFIKENYPNKGIFYCRENVNLNYRVLKRIIKKFKLVTSQIGKYEEYLHRKSVGIRLSNLNEVNNKAKYDDYIPTFDNRGAYALGLLWADGYMQDTKGKVKTLKIEVVEEDYHHFENSLSVLGTLSTQFRTRLNRKSQARGFITNMGMNNWLYDNGFKNKKCTSPEFIFNSLNEQNHADFLRGWIDGDGCFYINEKRHLRQFSLAGNYNQNWDYLCKIFTKLNINYKIIKRCQRQKSGSINSYSILRISNIEGIVKLIDYVYYDNMTDFLPRKYKKAIMIKNIRNDDQQH